MNFVTLLNYPIYLLIFISIYGCLTIALNVQWGYAGLFNAGVAGFFAVGAYTSAILTSPAAVGRIGGFSLPVPVGMLGAMLACVVAAWPVGKVCLRFRSDYLAIVSIGVAEAIRLVVRSEEWLTNGSRGIIDIPRPFGDLPYAQSQVAFLGLSCLILLVVYFLVERQLRSPWGRMMRAIRDNETAAQAMGKDVPRRRLEAFILGSALMGLAGALYVHLTRVITPDAIDPMIVTFLVWIMVILGGSGNNRGVLVGALIIWVIWSASELVTDQLPADIALKAKYARMFLVGLLLQVILRLRPEGLLPERVGTAGGSGDLGRTSPEAIAPSEGSDDV
ncbi:MULTISPECIES: branched-chain amino acid ABC transporter permease [Xanthobacteraceae]|uniref:Branched-chain amino acid transport system permease protein n=1 Tax=Labrys monachus TaxID=217067 RepID=A0ABU0FFW8_9HYPH|nr:MULTISPECIES: branched-chain amino acid ABC transporter permease [Xanthobacteraceae]MBS7538204.1 branched-chain amino acid ABC transporter permease [Ancylobacter lacus]MDQ0393504.1 branched-chain amino acid transport system permease protein [Labrys monachus]